MRDARLTSGPTPKYSVLIGHALTAGQSPLYTQAELVGGVFKLDIAKLGNVPRILYLQYAQPTAASSTPPRSRSTA